MKPEQRLLNDIRNGSRLAMRKLYDQYSGYAMAVGLRYVPDRDDLKDVLQNSFIKIFSSIGGYEYRGEGMLKAWIAKIVANEALDFIKKSSRMVFTTDIPDEEADEEPDVERVPQEALVEMIGRLPEGYRMVLNMYVFGQMSHKEIAAKLGISASTSASQFFHAKKMLAKMINEYLRTR